MPDAAAFFLSSTQDVAQLDLMEISHPSFSQTYRFVRNHSDGVTVDLSASELGVEFGYYPARVSLRGSRDDLDSAIRIDLGDLGEIIPQEIDRLRDAGTLGVKPRLRYWAFRSDDLTGPIIGPLSLDVDQVSSVEAGSGLDCRARATNRTRTGERYKPDRFAALQGFF